MASGFELFVMRKLSKSKPTFGRCQSGRIQKATVVGDWIETPILRAKVPPNQRIPYATFQCGRRHAQLRNPLASPARNVPVRLAKFRQRTQIVVRPRLALIPLYFDSLHGPNYSLLLHRAPLYWIPYPLYTGNRARCRTRADNPRVCNGITHRANHYNAIYICCNTIELR